MSLKKIEIFGFKSFSDHTVIELDENQNLVCIVGPNGCGKSNISDAIRWVLGEASAKQIRGNNMRDVIFSGSEKVKQMNFAEVTLYFDNPIREGERRVFNYSGEEFSIGRKIFRNKGDNVYFFNGKPCRRSEIMALFRDTGAGKDGFSIVGQGRISDIIISKNTDRRKIFDEAAGVSNDKSRKKDAQKKLQDFNQNLMILENQCSYLENDLTVLEEEVEKANRYLEVTNKIKDLELNYFIHIKESLDGDKAKIQGDIDSNKDYLNKQQEGLSEVKRKVAKLDSEIIEIDAEIKRKYELREQLKVSSVERDGKYKLHKQRIESEKYTLNKLIADRETAVKEIEKLHLEIEEVEKQIIEVTTKSSESEIESAKLRARKEILEDDVAALSREIDIYNDKRLSGVEDISLFKSLEAGATATIDILKENIETSKKTIEESNTALSQETAKQAEILDKIRKTRESIQLADNEKRQLGPRYNSLKTENIGRANEYNEMIGMVASKKSYVEQLTERLKEERGYNRVTNSVLDRAKRDVVFGRYVCGAVGDLFTVDDKYYEAISTALGGSINNIITYDRESAKQILNYVKELHQGKLTTYPLCDVQGERLAGMYRSVLNMSGVVGIASDLIQYDSRYDNIYTHLLGRIVVVDCFDTASRLRNQYPRSFKMVTLNGEYFDVSGSISAGDNKSGTEKVLKTAKAELQDLEAKMQAIKKAFDDTNIKINQATDKIEALRNLIEKYNSDLSNLATEKATVETTIETLRAKIIDAESSLEAYTMRLQQKESEITEAQTKSGEVSSDRSNFDTIIENSKKNLAIKQKELEEVIAKLNANEITISTLLETKRNLEDNGERYRTSLSQKTAMISSFEFEITNMTNMIEELEKNMPELELNSEETKKIEEIKAEIEKHSARKEEITKLKEGFNIDIENFNERIIRASQAVASLETKLESIDKDVEEWGNSIKEKYDLTYETALPYKREDYEHSKAKPELSKLNVIKNRLGSVNLNAEETYKTKKEEYDRLRVSLDDINKGKEDTEILIEKITVEINKKFSEAFESIRNYFQQTFSDLFGGGKAELLLTPSEIEGEDEGVDIAVQLPGKNRKSLSLLSGGEQTLTAIAIIFAILRYRSSPFVILDEVESALDESNCVRFARYLKEFSKIARFIVISHKKPTMEVADILYGVTMMRPGISNIVSVSMSDAQKLSEDNE